MSLVLVINSGSSSLKFKLFRFPDKKVVVSGQVEKIGLESALFNLRAATIEVDKELGKTTHEQAFYVITQELLKQSIISSLAEVKIVGHRVVHGGDKFNAPIIIDNEVKNVINELSFLAPLHNPPNLIGIVSAEKAFPGAIQIAVFDTAFHSTIPEVAHRYAIPEKYYQKDHIRAYGFHGTSHKYVSEKWYATKGKKSGKIITLHLGNGCSMAAVRDGKCLDTSLGFSPTGGLIMGTRSGDIDPMIVLYLQERLRMTPAEINTLLNKESGMLGISGKVDLREIIEAAEGGDTSSQLALDMNIYRIKKYIGSYTAVMNGLDAVVFTAGIGENSAYFREKISEDMEWIGMKLDFEKNKTKFNQATPINVEDSKVEIWVIPTNEELEIASQAFKLLDE